MSSAVETAEGGRSLPVRMIHELYMESMAARKMYQEAREVGGSYLNEAENRLNHTLRVEFEALRALLKNKNSTEKIWKGSKEYYLYEEEFYWVDGEHIEGANSGEQVPWDQIDLSHLSEEEQEEFVDEYVNTETIYVGLEALDDLYFQNRRDRVAFQDSTGVHSREVMKPQNLDAELVYRAFRLMDEALDRLGLGAEVEDEVVTTEITKELVENVQEWFAETIAKLRDGTDEFDPAEGAEFNAKSFEEIVGVELNE